MPGSEGHGRNDWIHASCPHCLERYLFCLFLSEPWSYTYLLTKFSTTKLYVFQEEKPNGLNDQMLGNTFEE